MFPQYSAWSNWGLVDLSTAATVADYQVKLILDIEPEMNITGSNVLDFRACTLLGDGLNYWIESVSNSTFTVWVKVPLGTQQIVYYWGNNQAVSESNGDNVFSFFCGFTSTSELNAKFNITNDVGISNDELVLTSGSTRGVIESKTGFTQPIIAVSRAKSSALATLNINIISLQQHNDTRNRGGAAFTNNNSNGVSFTTVLSGTSTENSYNLINTISNYHQYKIQWELGSSKLYIDDVLRITNSSNVAGGTQYLTSREGTTVGQYGYLDWVYVREYAATEPIINAVYKFRNVPLITIPPSSGSALEISSTAELTGSTTANTLLKKFIFSESQQTVSATATINLDKYISSIAESIGSETANSLLQKLISSSSDSAGSSTANISLKKFLSSIAALSGSSEATVYLQTSDLSILAELSGSATANISVRKALSSTAEAAGNSTSKVTLFKLVSSSSASEIESLVNSILSKHLSSQAGIVGSATVNITKYTYISGLGLIVASATATIDGGTAISLDFTYPLTVLIFLKQRTATIQKNIRTVTFE